MKEKWSKQQCHEMLPFHQRYIKRTSVPFSIPSEASTTNGGVCSPSKNVLPFSQRVTMRLWGWPKLETHQDLLPRELLATSSSHAEKCLGNSYKKEELKKLNSLDFASGLQQLGQWMQPSLMAAVGTELCWEELQQALSRSLSITASENCCSPRVLHVLLSFPMPCIFLWHKKSRQ